MLTLSCSTKVVRIVMLQVLFISFKKSFQKIIIFFRSYLHLLLIFLLLTQPAPTASSLLPPTILSILQLLLSLLFLQISLYLLLLNLLLSCTSPTSTSYFSFRSYLLQLLTLLRLLLPQPAPKAIPPPPYLPPFSPK